MDIFIPNKFSANTIAYTDPYVYLLIDKKTNMKVIGSHNGQKGFRYSTSTKAAKDEILARPQDFDRVILFQSKILKEVREFERDLLVSEKVTTNDEYYNKSKNLYNQYSDIYYCDQCNGLFTRGHYTKHHESCCKRVDEEYSKDKPNGFLSSDNKYLKGYSYDFVSKKYSYDPDAGAIFNRYGNQVTATDKHGYLKVSLYNGERIISLYGSRMAWFLHYGWIDDSISISYLNGDKSDIRIDNLYLTVKIRNLTKAKSIRNTPRGLSGVNFDDETKSWTVAVGGQYYGSYSSEADAQDQYENMQHVLNFYPDYEQEQ